MNNRKKWVTVFVLFCFVILSTLLYRVLVHKSNGNEERIKVAVLDSGINEEHEFFEDITFRSPSEDKDDKGADHFNHGTGVTSLLIDSLTKSQKEALVIYNVKILDDNGIGDPNSMKKGLEWAIEENVDVMNISAGFQTYDEAIDLLIKKAVNQGMVIIASAGNNVGFEVDYPARLNEVISISSINRDKNPSPTSSVGKIDFVSVGEKVKVANNDNTYGIKSGSSYATAKVTGYLIKGMFEDPDITDYNSAYSYLLHAAKPLGSTMGKDLYGNGLIED